MNNIGEKIKTKRIENGWSQEELASRMGYKTKSTITKIEKGTNDVSQSNIVKFAKVLNTTVAYLMGWGDSVIEHQNSLNLNKLSLKQANAINIIYKSIQDMTDEEIDKMLEMLNVMFDNRFKEDKKSADAIAGVHRTK